MRRASLSHLILIIAYRPSGSFLSEAVRLQRLRQEAYDSPRRRSGIACLLLLVNLPACTLAVAGGLVVVLVITYLIDGGGKTGWDVMGSSPTCCSPRG